MTENTKMNLWEKLIELRKKVSYIQKTEQKAQGVSSSNVLAKIRPAMDELKLLLIPSITKTNTFPKKNYGKPESIELFTEIWMLYTWKNTEDPTQIEVCDWYSQGVDTGEKGIGKALTYSEKYFLLKFFNIPTDKDDPDTFSNKNFEAMTRIQGQAIKKACDSFDITEESRKEFLNHCGISKHTSREDSATFLSNIDDKIKQWLGGTT